MTSQGAGGALARVAMTVTLLGVLGCIGVMTAVRLGGRGALSDAVVVTLLLSMGTAFVGGVVTLIVGVRERMTVAVVVGMGVLLGGGALVLLALFGGLAFSLPYV